MAVKYWKCKKCGCDLKPTAPLDRLSDRQQALFYIYHGMKAEYEGGVLCPRCMKQENRKATTFFVIFLLACSAVIAFVLWQVFAK